MSAYLVGRIAVYRDDPAWIHGKPWFELHPADLERLLVATYSVTSLDPEAPSDWESLMPEHIIAVEKAHPECILVYIAPPHGWRERYQLSRKISSN